MGITYGLSLSVSEINEWSSCDLYVDGYKYVLSLWWYGRTLYSKRYGIKLVMLLGSNLGNADGPSIGRSGGGIGKWLISKIVKYYRTLLGSRIFWTAGKN